MSAEIKFPPAFCLHESGHSLSVSRDGALFYEDLIYQADYRGDRSMVEVVRADCRDALLAALSRLTGESAKSPGQQQET